MANWKETLNIADLHAAFDEEKISIEDLSKEVYARCKKLSYANDSIFLDIIEGLPSVDDVEDYDDIYDRLLEYGNWGNRLWVRTIL